MSEMKQSLRLPLVAEDAPWGFVVLRDRFQMIVCEVGPETDAGAFARRVNAYDNLVAALRRITSQETGSVEAPFGLRGTAECTSCERMQDIAADALKSAGEMA
jgi:hypothetical protein